MTGPHASGAAHSLDDVLLARAYLNRAAEAACVPLWGFVRRVGPVVAAERVRAREAPEGVLRATESRHATADAEADLAAAERRGIRLVVPESAEWPHFAMACLEQSGLRRLAEYEAGHTAVSDQGEDVPPLALWVRGDGELSTAAVRSVGIVGARAATPYGEHVAKDLASRLALRDVTVVSGGAYGIDAAAHRGALAVGGGTWLISAGGLDRAYPPAHTRLFDQCAESGLLLSESPPGSTPQRRRFLTRNRLIAALSTGTVVVEASARSGASNTASHAVNLGRPLMAVPGPVTSAMSAGCHAILRRYEGYARLVTGPHEVLELVGTLGEPDEPDIPQSGIPQSGIPQSGIEGAVGGGDAAAVPTVASATVTSATVTSAAERERIRRRGLLDGMDAAARAVFDSLPARGATGLDDLVTVSGVPVAQVLRSVTALELAGLVERRGDGVALARG